MRKYLLLTWLLLIVGEGVLYAQTQGLYKMTLIFSHLRNTGNPMQNIEYKVSYESDDGLVELHTWNSGSVGRWQLIPRPAPITRYIPASPYQLPQRLKFWCERTWKRFFDTKSRIATNTLSLSNLHPNFFISATHGDDGDVLFDSSDTRLMLEIVPVSIRLHYYTGAGQGAESAQRLLPDKDEITLKATKGFTPAFYRWQYQVSGEYTWHNVPPGVRYSEDGATMALRGRDLFSQKDFNRLVQGKKNVLFRINAKTDERPHEAGYEKIILTPTYSLPHILSHMVEQEHCHQSGDASIRVTLDRGLRPGEALAYFQQGGAGHNIEALDDTNSFLITDLVAGSYSFYIRGTHDNGLQSYSDPTKLQFSAQILERPAITLSSSHRDVSCFGGGDGSITLTASGGTGHFTAGLYTTSGSLLTTKTFTTGSVTLGHLPAGTYSVRLRDSNDCVPHTPSGEELTPQFTLSEPSEAVAIELHRVVEPLAHNSSDGSLEIAVSGGTPLSSGYQVRFVRKDDGEAFTPTSSYHDDGKFIYKLANIRQGEYTAIAEDLRYSPLSEEDTKEPCGCRAKLAISLTAPPPLSLTLSEVHYVSCHGDSDGAIVAHARGGKPITSARLPYTYSWYRLQAGTKASLRLQSDSIARGLEAGKYLVQITDANGISMESSVLDLHQPEALGLSLQATPPSCSDAEGRIVAQVRGGIPPYSYEWNKEGAKDATLMIQESGSYVVRVTDSRGCSVTGSIEVTTPNALSIQPTITHPTCPGASNGSIRLSLSGGTAPYTVSWEDGGSTSLSREDLRAGVYVAHIQDRAGCAQHYHVVLSEPDPIDLTLGAGFTLCQGQSRLLRVQTKVSNLEYHWRRNGEELTEQGSELLVSQAGTYEVLATTPEGCSARASVEVKVSDIDLPIDITAPSTVSVNEPIHVVNISRVKADRLEWQLPQEAQVLQRSDEEVILQLPRTGVYEIKLVGYLGGCSTLISQRVEVREEHDLLPREDSPIRQFLVSPSPTTGNFRVLVELSKASDFTLRLLSPSSVEMDRKEIKQTQRQSFGYELRGDTEGIFGVELTVGQVKSLLKVRKKRK